MTGQALRLAHPQGKTRIRHCGLIQSSNLTRLIDPLVSRSKAEVDKSIKTREAITVGAVVGGVLVMFGVIAYLLFLRRRRKLKKARAALAKMPLTPALPMQTAPRSMSPTDAEKGYGPGNAPLPTWHAVAPERRNSVASTASSRTDSIKSVSSTAPLFIKPRRSVELARPPSATMGRSTSSRSSTLDQLGDTSSRTSRPVRDSVRSVKVGNLA